MAFVSLISRCTFNFYNSFFCLYFFCLALNIYYSASLSRGLCVGSLLCAFKICGFVLSLFHVPSDSSMTPNRILKFIITELVTHFQLTSPLRSFSFTTKAKRKVTILFFFFNFMPYSTFPLVNWTLFTWFLSKISLYLQKYILFMTKEPQIQSTNSYINKISFRKLRVSKKKKKRNK